MKVYLDAMGILYMQSIYGYKFNSVEKYSDGIYLCEIEENK